ncbi:MULTISPECIES: GntR family transcriptional regulator [Streptomyces]|uniref:GntR family transcriptional regulator n=1 Tax=Streptomyces TaxID=1883 RepID=UPI00099D576C|nr:MULTISPECIES: GntR family transcriptional regulator [Streptomyces]QHF96459.1 GntR family transcriptional regulator [Streptomyces sp. NHF165]
MPPSPPTAGSAPRLSRVPLHTQVRRYVLEGLLAGQWGPGDRITERGIAQELGVSQAPVREALRELETMDLVECAPNKGARVRELSLEQLREVYIVRAALERRAAELAAVRLEGEVGALAEHAEAMEAAARAGETDGQIEHAVAFHRAIVHACGVPALIRHWEWLGVEAWTRLSIRRLRPGLHENAEDHRAVVEALRRQDPYVGRLMELHVLDYAPGTGPGQG